MAMTKGNGEAGRNKDVLGENFMFPPRVIDDIHIKAQLGRYRMRGMALFKKIPTWDDLTFMPGTLTRSSSRAIARNAAPGRSSAHAPSARWISISRSI